jgi:hypothetical protein
MKILITENLANNLRERIKNLGLSEVAKLMDLDIKQLIKIAFNNDLKEFYKHTGYIPYEISPDGERMFIDEILIDKLNLEDRPHWSNSEKKLGNFIFGTKNGQKYVFNARVTGKDINYSNGQEFMSVAGMCVDLGLGFGYSDLKEKEKLGIRAQSQIFKQIIEKYNLDSYI